VLLSAVKVQIEETEGSKGTIGKPSPSKKQTKKNYLGTGGVRENLFASLMKKKVVPSKKSVSGRGIPDKGTANKIEDILEELTRYAENISAGKEPIVKTGKGIAGEKISKAIRALIEELIKYLGNNDSKPAVLKEDISKLIELAKKLEKDLLEGKKNYRSLLEELAAFVSKAKEQLLSRNTLAEASAKALTKTSVSGGGELYLKEKADRPVDGKPKLTVIDLRRDDHSSQKKRLDPHQLKTVKSEISEPGTVKAVSSSSGGKGAEVLFNSGNSGSDSTMMKGETGNITGHAKATFESVTEQFNELIGKKIFKGGSIIVRDNENGEIRFHLKPESLGSVRIKLTINENRIVGKIIVENNSVKDALNNGLESLKDALKSNGFQTASFDVSVGSELSGKMDEHGGEKTWGKSIGRIPVLKEIEDSIPNLLEIKRDELLIDMIV